MVLAWSTSNLNLDPDLSSDWISWLTSHEPTVSVTCKMWAHILFFFLNPIKWNVVSLKLVWHYSEILKKISSYKNKKQGGYFFSSKILICIKVIFLIYFTQIKLSYCIHRSKLQKDREESSYCLSNLLSLWLHVFVMLSKFLKLI